MSAIATQTFTLTRVNPYALYAIHCAQNAKDRQTLIAPSVIHQLAFTYLAGATALQDTFMPTPYHYVLSAILSALIASELLTAHAIHANRKLESHLCQLAMNATVLRVIIIWTAQVYA